MVEVEVLDGARAHSPVHGHAGAAGHGGAPGRGELPGEDHVGPPRRRHLRRGLRLLAALAVVALVVIGGATALEHRSVAARQTILAGVEGLAPRLDVAPSELWALPVRHGVDLLSDVVLTYEWHQGAVDAVVAQDPADGRLLWRTPLADSPRAAHVDCAGVVDRPEGRAVVCQVFGIWEVDLTLVVPGRTRQRDLYYLDVATGALLAQEPVGVGGDLTVVDDDLLTLAYGERDVVVERRQGAEAGAGWVSHLPRPSSGDPPTVTMRIEHGNVILHGAVTAVLDVETGAQKIAWPAALGRWEDATFAGVGARPGLVWTSTPPGGEPASAVRLASGARREVPGRVLQAVVDDGSAPDVLLVQAAGGGLQAVALHGLAVGTKPSVLWTVPSRRNPVLMRLEERVVVADHQEVRSVDARTGEVMWAQPMGAADEPTAVTDGDVVLVMRYEVAVGRVIRALDLRSGSVVWEVPMPDRTQRLVVVGDLLVAVGGNDVVVLGRG